jgi:single-stranded-DNA-specific exonuclease
MRWKYIGGEDAPLGEALRALAGARGWSADETKSLCDFLEPRQGGSGTAAGSGRKPGPRADGTASTPILSEFLDAFRDHPAYRAARDRIKVAAGMGHRVVLFGDYDADGITAVVQLHRFLSAYAYPARDGGRHRDLATFVPDRMRHGYGLTTAAVQECLNACRETWARPPVEPREGRSAGRRLKHPGRGPGSVEPPILLITLDCGSASPGVIAELKARGIDTIVVDHHQPHEPPGDPHPAVAHLNPRTWPGKQPELELFRTLSASGLAFLLCEALQADLDARDWDREAACVLAGLGTVADVVSLVGPNRLLVKAALHHANRPGFLEQRLPGLATLHERSGGGLVDARTLGYRWGPRVNASGRIEDARAPVELLLASDPGRIAHVAEACERANDHRKKLTEEALEEALELAAERELAGVKDRVLVLFKESWEPGIVGIVAGRLRERLGMPVIVFGKHQGQDTWKGSGRSVAEYNLGAEVRRAVEEGVAAGGGGHHLAAGVTVAAGPGASDGNLEVLRTWLNDRCLFNGRNLEPEYEILAPVHAAEALDRAAHNPGDATALVKFWCDLYDRFEPFGAGNPRPGLLLRDVELVACQAKTTTKGVKAGPGPGSEGARPAARVWAISARFRWNDGDSLLVDWTDPEAARKVWPDPATFSAGASPAVRYDLVVEPHHSVGAGKGSASRTWYDWRVVACARAEP